MDWVAAKTKMQKGSRSFRCTRGQPQGGGTIPENQGRGSARYLGGGGAPLASALFMKLLVHRLLN